MYDVSKRIEYEAAQPESYRVMKTNVCFTAPIADLLEALPLRFHGMSDEQISQLLCAVEAAYVNRQAAKAGYIEPECADTGGW